MADTSSGSTSTIRRIGSYPTARISTVCVPNGNLDRVYEPAWSLLTSSPVPHIVAMAPGKGTPLRVMRPFSRPVPRRYAVMTVSTSTPVLSSTRTSAVSARRCDEATKMSSRRSPDASAGMSSTPLESAPALAWI